MPDRLVHLLVRSPFGGHDEGARITDPKLVSDILAGPHALHVMQTPAEQPDAAEGDAAPRPAQTRTGRT